MKTGLINSPATGFRIALEGLRIVFRPGLRRFVVVPFLVNLVVFGLLIWFGAAQFEALLDRWLPEESWLSWFRWLLWPLFATAFLLVVFFTFTLVANLLGAPFNDMLSAKVEAMLEGRAPDDGTAGILAAVWPAVRSELQKMAYFIPRAAPLLLLFVIPGLQALAPFVWGLFGAWSLALEYTEYPYGNNGIEFRNQRRTMKQHRLLALGFGGGILLLMLIPLVNFFVMPAAVAGATVLWVRHLKDA